MLQTAAGLDLDFRVPPRQQRSKMGTAEAASTTIHTASHFELVNVSRSIAPSNQICTHQILDRRLNVQIHLRSASKYVHIKS